MRHKIHFTIDEYTDDYVVEGDTIEEVQKANRVEMEKRGLTAEKNNCWSEEIKED